MSHFLPRRVQDLSPLKSDSEDELKTPFKDSGTLKSRNTSIFKPKRIADLPPLQPDSEDEDNLNCARLNESFLLGNDESLLEYVKKTPFLNPILDDEKENQNNLNVAQCDKTGVQEEKAVEGREAIVENACRNELKKAKTITKICVINQGTSQCPIQNALLVSKMKDVSIKETLDPSAQSGTLEQPKYRPINTSRTSTAQPNQKIGCLSIFNTLRNKSKETTDNNYISTASGNQIPPQNCPAIPLHPVINPPRLKSPSPTQNSCRVSIESVNIINKNEDRFQTPQIKASFHCNTGSTMKRLQHFPHKSTIKNRNESTANFRSQKILFSTPTVPRPNLTGTTSTMQPSLPSSALAGNLSVDLALNESFKPKRLTDQSSPPVRIGNTSNSSLSLDLKITSSDLLSFLGCGDDVDRKSISGTETNGILINGNRYYIGKKIGSGASSSVFLARSDSGMEYALKIVDLQNDPIVVEGYLNETKLLAKLQGNNSVIRLHEYYHIPQNKVLYMLMEIGDSDLHKVLQSHTSDIPLYTLTMYWYQILQGVNYIHQNGVIHSDLKPANFLMVNGRLKLIDFGIASNIATDSTSIIKHSQAGTFNYISPEALTDTSSGCSPVSNQLKIRISTKSDVWSLGCILYLLLYKKTPFADIKNINLKVSAICNPDTKIEYPALPNYYPLMLVEMAQQCLRHNAKQRPSAADLLKFPFHMIIPIDS